MRLIHLSIFLLISCIFLISQPADAAWLWGSDSGKWSNAKDIPKDTPEEQFSAAKVYFEKEKYKRALQEFDKLIKHYPQSHWAAEAQFYKGLTYEALDNAGEAAKAYRILTDKYPYSERLNDAIEKEFELAEAMMSGKKTKLLGFEILPAQDFAANLYRHIVKAAPYGPYGDVSQFRLADAELAIGNFDEAEAAYQAVIDEYPNSEYAPKAKFKLAQVTYEAALDEGQHETRLDEAVSRYEGFKKTYPDSTLEIEANDAIKELRTKKAENIYTIAEFYEARGKLKSAKIYYQDIVSGFSTTEVAERAALRLEAIAAIQSGKKPKKKVKKKADSKEKSKKKFWLF